MNQHRRDLNTNELEKIVTKATPFLEENGNRIIYALCAALLLFAVIFYLYKTSSTADSSGWAAFTASGSADDYAKVADKFGNEAVGDWALLNEAELTLNQGLRSAFSDREGAMLDLKAAQEKYETLLNKSNLHPKVEERGLIGLARCLETMWDGTDEKPIEAYEQFTKQFPDSAYKEIAEERIKSLKAESGREFYAWFHAQSPKPGDRRMPQDGLPSDHPPIDPGSLIELPEVPDMLKTPAKTSPAFPDVPQSEAPAGNSEDSPPVPPLPEDGEKQGTAPLLPE